MVKFKQHMHVSMISRSWLVREASICLPRRHQFNLPGVRVAQGAMCHRRSKSQTRDWACLSGRGSLCLRDCLSKVRLLSV